MSFKFCIPLFILLLSGIPVSAEIEKTALSPAGVVGETLFHEHDPDDLGIRFVNKIDEQHDLRRLYISGFACGGVSLGDLDQDGLLDVILTTGAGQNRIYRQTGPWKFEEVVWDESSVDVWSTGAAVLDLDNDGDLDIYVCNYDQPNRLYLNETQAGGKITFREAAAEWGLDISDASLNPSFADYDLDGDLDIFIVTYEFKRDKGRPLELPVDDVNTANPKLKPGFDKYYTLVKHGPGNYVYYNIGRKNFLLRNELSEGKKKFTDVSEAAGIQGRTFGLSCTWYDHDADGDPDLYICNDFDDPDQLYLNNGDGTFTDVIKLAAPYTSWYAMGADAADFNGDGRFDLMIADMGMTTHFKQKTAMGNMAVHEHFLDTAIPRQAMRNTLMINSGTGRFMETANLSGLSKSDWTWAVKCPDFDCDGLPDVFFANGMARRNDDSDQLMPPSYMFGNIEFDYYDSSNTREEENLVFRNVGDLKFENVTKAWGLGEPTMSYSAATGDLDNDGDPDLVVTHLDRPVSFYENTTSGDTERISVSLRGQTDNHFGVGSVVRVTAGGKTQTKALNPMTGFISCNEPVLQFGLGATREIEGLEVEWPNGGIDRYGPFEAGYHYTLTESPKPVAQRDQTRPKRDFVRVNLADASHKEVLFDDYREQPLLPWKQSQMGPGIAFADFDRDGDQDFYLAQSKGAVGSLYYQQPDRSFKKETPEALRNHEDSEDMNPLFFDADGDGQLDLLVTSGSNEDPAGDQAYLDRLYLGSKDGSGFDSYYLFPGEAMSSGPAAVADFDHDGDLDVFIGGRVIPGKWPTSPGSRLYLNNSRPGKPAFSLADAKLAPGLADCRRITGALWSDIDGDGWSDLLLTSEYGPVMVFANEAGTLVEKTKSLGFSERLGIWNGVTSRDLDGDGDIDYLLSNFGLNTTYKASQETPEILYYGDLEGTGNFQVVESKFEAGIQLPRRGLSCSSNAMPSIKKNLGTYKNFALSSLAEIYTPQRLEESGRLELNFLESCVLINESTEGSFSFKIVPLPRMAQLAPAFGAAMTDLDGDGKTDLVLGQNFHSPQREVGRMSGSVGATVLRGTGDAEVPFTVVSPSEAGIVINGDVKGLAVVELNGDGIPDLVFTENDGPVSTFLNTSAARFLGVKLSGKPGNLSAVGARVTVVAADGTSQTDEASTGGGYLSQSDGTLFFGLGKTTAPVTIKVTWPDGTKTEAEAKEPGTVNLTWK